MQLDSSLTSTLPFATIINNNMADMRTCEVEVTQEPQT
jgi:hypothetical protein